jgi:squalene-hopene/tetraprenyl-beta-curcumene cyclase
MVQSDGRIDPGPRGLSYPVYTAANAVIVLSRPRNAQYRKERDAWLAYLRARQLTEELGWQPSDREYGGWGYANGLPRKPSSGQATPPLTESNLSATVFALTALRSAAVPANDPALRKALLFVKRCQNYNDDPKLREPVFDDGGFFFIYADSVRNKAGVAGQDDAGRERYTSYGSTTADGLRALLACGLPVSDERVAAARSWLERNFSAAGHPGKYPDERLGDRPALYFYYCYSVAQGLRALELQDAQQPAGKVPWRQMLTDELLRRQRADGSWFNPAKAVREDEPVLATSFAVLTLAVCRERLTGTAVEAIVDR